ncbi:bis(5'-nucleosyl)-tetraphosphatase (symmetrical) YqeK [Spirulina sp. CS-785/01]|uniref:bis(5'-nucleosyl)-tetraphosphatase (symmetrical) YqeK n=1 Tax=Spirulina sp. CS-785/01 TaxID=3021716 RepID=UPI003FA7B575
MRDRILTWLADHVPPARVQHILGVEQMSGELAESYNLDPQKARQAGLLHDLAKYFPPKTLLDIAQTHSLPLDDIFYDNPHLLHADVSAIVAQEEFNITDPDILAAIANHTLGSPQMSPLSCIVFLADSLEPGRGNKPPLPELRQTSFNHLYQAVWHTSDFTIQHLIKKGRIIHPRAVLTRNWALWEYRHQQKKQREQQQPLQASL